MGKKESDGGKEKKRYQIEVSRLSIFLWSVALFFFMAWIFALGVFAGRGLLPGVVETMTELKAQVAKLQQMIAKKDRNELEQIRKLQKDPKFAFFDELSAKNNNTRKSPPPPERKPATSSRAKKAANPSKGTAKYVVQVASLETEAKAKDMVARLARKGYQAYFYKVFVKGREYFRVRCGIYESKAEAVAVNRRLTEKEKMNGFIKKIEEK
ncbi:MAG: hypothetical protein B5M55_03300 [Desulfococcus sp. 4484_242]|nr:MAG: hypothetical protein B5M55_03300 [Desulfococcus sp. 4484_242]